MDRGQVVFAPGFHQVVAGEELIGGKDAAEVLAGDVHELRETGAGADEDGLEALAVHQFIDGNRAAHDDVGLDLDAQGAHRVDLVRNAASGGHYIKLLCAYRAPSGAL